MTNSVDQYEDYQAFRSPAAKSIRGVFGVGIFWLIFWAGVVGTERLVDRGLNLFVQQACASWASFLGLIITLGAAIAVLSSFGGPAGAVRSQRLRRFGLVYAYPLMLASGVFIGWEWRDNTPPDSDGDKARTIAWQICGQMPVCVQQATAANDGIDVGYFIKSELVIDSRGNKALRYRE